MNDLTLSTGRRVRWEVNGHGDRKMVPFVALYAPLGDVLAPTPEEKIEAVTAINKVLHPQKEAPNA